MRGVFAHLFASDSNSLIEGICFCLVASLVIGEVMAFSFFGVGLVVFGLYGAIVYWCGRNQRWLHEHIVETIAVAQRHRRRGPGACRRERRRRKRE